MARTFICACALLMAIACGDGRPTPDSGPTRDGGGEPAVDAGDRDAGSPGDAGSDAGTHDAGPALDPSPQITLVRGTPPGVISPALPIDGATVTYVRSSVGDDPAAFFVQGAMGGPALLIAVDPSTLDPAPVAGDVVSFRVGQTERVADQLRVVGFEAWERLRGGASLAALVQDLGSATDASDADRYESELVTARGVLAGGDVSGGPSHRRFRFVTAGDELDLRLPMTVLETSLVGDGCDVTVGPSPMWRFESSAQLMAYEAAHLIVHACPAPSVRSATAADPTHVTVRFSRPLDAATVSAADFTFAGGALTSSAAVVDGDSVLVTTSSMTDGVTYTVIVSGLEDALGTPIGSMNTASFRGLGPGVASPLLTEYVEGSFTERALEITNLGSASIELSSCEVRLYSNGGTTPATHALPAGTLAPGESFVVCHASSSPALMARCDQVDTTPVNFNGDDAIELWCGGALADAFGQTGFDPGTAWSNGAVSTVDQTLRRRCGISVGDRVASDPFDPALEWESAGLDDLTDLGAHCR
jgi:hypothetical protein